MAIEITPSLQAQLARKMRAYRKTAHTMAVQMDEAFIVRQRVEGSGNIVGEQYCNAGDYLAMNAKGGVYGIPKQTFEESYESVN